MRQTDFHRTLLTVSDGVEIATYEGGGADRPVALFAPPLGVPAAAFFPVLKRLAMDFRVLTWDTRGYPSPTADFDALDVSLASHARDVLALLDHRAVSDAHLIGYCSGAAVVLQTLQQRPELATHVALVCGAFNLSAVAGGNHFTEMAAAMFDELATNRQATAEMRESLADAVKSPQWDHWYDGLPNRDEFKQCLQGMYDDAETLYRYARLQSAYFHEPTDALLDLHVPNMLVIGVDDDHVVPPSWFKHICACFPESRVSRYPSGGHWAFCKGNRILDDVSIFFASAGVRSRPAARGQQSMT